MDVLAVHEFRDGVRRGRPSLVGTGDPFTILNSLWSPVRGETHNIATFGLSAGLEFHVSLERDLSYDSRGWVSRLHCSCVPEHEQPERGGIFSVNGKYMTGGYTRITRTCGDRDGAKYRVTEMCDGGSRAWSHPTGVAMMKESELWGFLAKRYPMFPSTECELCHQLVEIGPGIWGSPPSAG